MSLSIALYAFHVLCRSHSTHTHRPNSILPWFLWFLSFFFFSVASRSHSYKRTYDMGGKVKTHGTETLRASHISEFVYRRDETKRTIIFGIYSRVIVCTLFLGCVYSVMFHQVLATARITQEQSKEQAKNSIKIYIQCIGIDSITLEIDMQSNESNMFLHIL